MRRTGVSIAFAVALVFCAVSPAVAQTTTTACGQPGYPGCSTSTTSKGSSQVQGEGNVRPGQSKTFEACGFQPGSTASVTFNGQSAGTVTADSSGCVHVQADVLANCPAVRVNGVSFIARQGRNDAVVNGTGSNGASRSVDFVFTVTCNGTARTGADTARWALFGLVLVLVGAAIVVLARRRRSHA